MCRPRPLPCPGTHLSQVYLLRTPDEANAVAEAADQRHVVIVGTSFISMEAAAFLVDRAASVTVVGRSSAPFSNVFGNVNLSLSLSAAVFKWISELFFDPVEIVDRLRRTNPMRYHFHRFKKTFGNRFLMVSSLIA